VDVINSGVRSCPHSSIWFIENIARLACLRCGSSERQLKAVSRAIRWRQKTEIDFQELEPMLAEKFFLLIETIRSRSYPDGGPIVVSTSPHVPIKLPSGKGK
jgi:hypothetical protein